MKLDVRWFLWLAAFIGCGQEGGPMHATNGSSAESPGGAVLGKLQVTSTAFAEGELIPVEFSGEGADTSPPLMWSGAPAGTKEFAILCHDPDAPGGTWWHWVLYNIPGDVTTLPGDVQKSAVLKQPAGARQGRNSWPRDNVGYRGPMPPRGHGRHRYVFTVYAVDRHIELAANLATPESLLKAMAGYVLAEGRLTGYFERN